ncbi:MAG: hypothetical protein DWQ34_10070 [Planctomycetota bacterium]|nr:MAG: hypothetical protein DWQ34_10070 [Planctomycetota bacterium]REK27035.1 MAG: hypothetical protein DWQ41_08560 [Planctomycetota bacterium]REK34701.1 MAG: hypothetical protein DWQ45_12840 [Planctomycetota bacterium]
MPPHHSLRFPEETEEAFRARVERVAVIARVLVEACLANHCVQELINDPELPYTERNCRQSPTVRLEYEQAVAIGELGTCLAATKSKHWGAGPWVMPLRPDDPVDAFRVGYIYRPNSLYNRRFEQRKRLKELLGRRNRKLVGDAQRHTKAVFLEHLTQTQQHATQRRSRY